MRTSISNAGHTIIPTRSSKAQSAGAYHRCGSRGRPGAVPEPAHHHLLFIPIFSLQGQEGRLFAPLAFTKTYAMAAAALLSITLVPVLMGWLIRGKIPAEDANPINRFLTRIYRPALDWVLARPKQALIIAGLIFASSLWPISQTGGEFMPQMNEGDLLYMPSALPGISTARAALLLQQTDRLIKTVPEVESVFGKAGRADTATDPAPLEMFETTIRFKPRANGVRA
jgi:Putative silver efflux pump